MKDNENHDIENDVTPRHLDEVSVVVNTDHNEECRKSDSIPAKLKTWYSHTSYRAIILSILSMGSIIFAFGGLFGGKIDSCECIGFVMSVITLFCPSPLQHR
jgi:hypothetical protein